MRKVNYFIMTGFGVFLITAFFSFTRSAFMNIALLFSAGLSLMLAFYLIDFIRSEENALQESGINVKERERVALAHELDEFGVEKQYLELKMSGLSKLYTLTKNMSSDLRFEELFRSLGDFIKENFSTEGVSIIFFSEGHNGQHVSGVHNLTSGRAGSDGADGQIEKVAQTAARSKKLFWFEKGSDLFNFGLPERLDNLIAIPLVTRKKVIAAMIGENVGPEDREKFLIIAPQIALQIERISLFEEVEKLSIADGLTSTLLRRYFIERFEEEIKRAKESKAPLAFIMADLDDFKKCNDAFGHLVGDVVLKEVASLLKSNVREIDLVSRLGGEEFGALLPESGKDGALQVANRMRKAIAEYAIKAYDETVNITISMGISAYPEDGKTVEDIMEKADRALYKAKAEGKDRVSIENGQEHC